MAGQDPVLRDPALRDPALQDPASQEPALQHTAGKASEPQAAEREVRSVALIGARGYVGRELLALLAGHPQLRVVLASSRELEGTRLAELAPNLPGDLCFTHVSPDDVAHHPADAFVLAVPNGQSQAWCDAIERSHPGALLLDLSADHRFDADWVYGLPERNRLSLRGARRIANPGCYATGIQVGLLPILDVLRGPARAFGVSGYSGAGTTPSPKNDPAVLRDNLLAYGLTGHVHEREVTRHLSHPVHFMPHVAAWFRGIHLTLEAELVAPLTEATLRARYQRHYGGEPFVRLLPEPPHVRDIAGRHEVALGGFTLAEGGERMVLVATIDNLLKGAASQALQNLNLAFGFEETLGLLPWHTAPRSAPPAAP